MGSNLIMPLQIKNLTLTDEEYKLIEESLKLVQNMLESSVDRYGHQVVADRLDLFKSIKLKLMLSAKIT